MPKCRTADPAAEDIQLVPKDHQLDVLDFRTMPAADEQTSRARRARQAKERNVARDTRKSRSESAGPD
jgi:hypothetical protein